jgi:hypothetical protein
MSRYLFLVACVCLLVLPAAVSPLARAVTMQNDPKGFQNIAWGSPLATRADLEITRPGPHVKEYQVKNSPPSFAGMPVDSVRLLSVDEQFARVTIRYQGDPAHQNIMAYLEHEFGKIERIPGQMMRGLNQQYSWRGTDTEINVTYQASTEKGFVFIDSRSLAPRFNDLLGDTVD